MLHQWHNLKLSHPEFRSINNYVLEILKQVILKGEVSHHWPRVWLVLISCLTTDNFCFYLENRLIQTSQTGGQRYSDASPFSIPCLELWVCQLIGVDSCQGYHDTSHNILQTQYRLEQCCDECLCGVFTPRFNGAKTIGLTTLGITIRSLEYRVLFSVLLSIFTR